MYYLGKLPVNLFLIQLLKKYQSHYHYVS